MEEEIWKPIKDFEKLYEVSNKGKVRSLSREVIVKNKYGAVSTRMTKSKVLKPQKRCEYYIVWLCKDGNPKQYCIHRLVGQAFLDNPNNYNCINHKDENKLNNDVNNLEYCTIKYNCNYGARNKTISIKNSNPRNNFRKVAQYDKNGNFIREYKNIYEAYKETNKNMTHIKACCNGKRRMAGNYIWQYV